MSKTRVLVIDDSLTMRALISGALERIPDVEVVGSADGAAEARGMVTSLRPDVLTLDVEMPGMSGIEYLEEIMNGRPMPVIMFSTRTEAGASSSIQALRLGAIDCFPKPKAAAQGEFDAVIGQLGKRIKSAKGVVPKPIKSTGAQAKDIAWNGRLVAIGAEAAHTAQLFDMLSTFPATCPPVIVVQHVGPGLIDGLATSLDQHVAPKVRVAQDGTVIEQGTIYFAPQCDQHLVVDSWPGGRLRLLSRDPVAGERPSISILLASVAKAAGAEGIGVLLAENEEDGVAGMRALLASGGRGLAPVPEGFALTRGDNVQKFGAEKLPIAILKLASQ